jgi:hypothetical protein
LLLAIVGCKQRSAQGTQAPENTASAVTVAQAITQDVPIYLDEIGKPLRLRR